jgi:hypothetical protein
MANQQASGGFARAFVPGLVLGLVVGAFAGATLPSLLAEQKLPAHTGDVPNGIRTDREREEHPIVDPELDLDLDPAMTDETGSVPDESADTDEQAPPVVDGSGADDSGSEEDNGGG